MLTQLCNAAGEDGESFTDQEIVDHMIFLMMAAHDTTTSALTTMIYALARHPDWQERVRAEVRDQDGDALAFDALDRLAMTDNTFREALRLYTPVQVIPRRAEAAFEFKGFEIPAQTPLTVSPGFTHHMAELWREPERFDPPRFAPERAEDRAHRFAWVPFGGGAHKCIGLHFAFMQVKAFTYQFLRRYRVGLPDDYRIDMALVPIPRPRDGLPITLEAL